MACDGYHRHLIQYCVGYFPNRRESNSTRREYCTWGKLQENVEEALPKLRRSISFTRLRRKEKHVFSQTQIERAVSIRENQTKVTRETAADNLYTS